LVFWAGWSITGSALSTVIAQYVGAMWLLKICVPHLSNNEGWRLDRTMLFDLLRVGRDLGIRVFSMLAIFTSSTVLAARSGDAVLAAHQIVNGSFLLLALCLDAVSIPAHTLLGESRGSGERKNQRLIAQRVYFWSAIVGICIAIVVFILSDVLPSLFTANEAVRDAASGGLQLLAVGLIPGAIAFGGDGVLIGLSDNRFLGVAAFGHTVMMASVLLFDSVRNGPGLATIWGLLAFWMLIRAVTVVSRSRLLLNR